MRSSAEAVEYAKALHALVVWLGICDGNMQEGSFRCDANVSVRKPGATLGTRREIKNLNSFRFLQQAIDFEVQWQIDRIEDGLAIEQATVLFNPDSGETRAMRSKEDAHDYRYFPDPDLPPLVIAPEWIERVRAAMPELPAVMAERFQRDDGLPADDAALMTQSLAFARYYEAVRDGCGSAKLAANWLMGEVSKRLNAEGRGIEAAPLPAATLAALIGRVIDGTVSNNGARQVFDALWTGQAGDVDAVIEARGLKQMNDSGALEAIVAEVIAANAQVGRGIPRRQGQGLQRARRPGHEGQQGQGEPGPGQRAAEEAAGLTAPQRAAGLELVAGQRPQRTRRSAGPQAAQAFEFGVVEPVDAHQLGFGVGHRRALRVGGGVVGVDLLAQLQRQLPALVELDLVLQRLAFGRQRLQPQFGRLQREPHVVERGFTRLVVRVFVGEARRQVAVAAHGIGLCGALLGRLAVADVLLGAFLGGQRGRMHGLQRAVAVQHPLLLGRALGESGGRR